jgi:hypothetical protein
MQALTQIKQIEESNTCFEELWHTRIVSNSVGNFIDVAAPAASQIAESALIDEIRCASMALAAILDNTEDQRPTVRMRSCLKLPIRHRYITKNKILTVPSWSILQQGNDTRQYPPVSAEIR